MVSSFGTFLVFVVSIVLPIALGGSVHLTTDPPVTQPVTRVFPSWLEAFETVKEEPPPILEQDIPPMVIPDPRNVTWRQYSRRLSAQLWRLVNYVHQVNQAPPAQPVYEPPPIYGTPDPDTGFYWVPDEEYDHYRKLNGKDGGVSADMIRPLSMKKDIEDPHPIAREDTVEHRRRLIKAPAAPPPAATTAGEAEWKRAMKWVESGEIPPPITDDARDLPSLRGKAKSGSN